RILFEIEGTALEETKQAFRLASDKLPIKTKLVVRR
ncbi:MAG: ribosomal protein L16, partial [Elusimicrobiaceae bacterium]|nr:ribosomal protein L16 [Elusimicrobiaceae bacterium]